MTSNVTAFRIDPTMPRDKSPGIGCVGAGFIMDECHLVAYRDAGADALYAPGLSDIDQIAAVVEAVGVPVNVLALPNGPSVAELASVGVRRVSTGGALAAAAYGALAEGARELLGEGTSRYAVRGVPRDALRTAFGADQGSPATPSP
jgi:2-methylisocitrate lyase-like PEP mutase family enzyme